MKTETYTPKLITEYQYSCWYGTLATLNSELECFYLRTNGFKEIFVPIPLNELTNEFKDFGEPDFLQIQAKLLDNSILIRTVCNGEIAKEMQFELP